jgi:hypothetical protein
LERLACVAIFVMSGCSNTQRFHKPFNPLLGETFEYVDDERGLRLFAEQISHHPPVSVAHTEHKDYVMWQQAHIKTKFLGNSFELYTNGFAYLYDKGTGELYRFSPPVNRVHNLILGTMWIEYHGESVVENMATGDRCVLQYESAGWFGRYSYKAGGYCETRTGMKPIRIEGKWNESAEASWVSSGERKKYAAYLQSEEGKARTPLPLSELPLCVRETEEARIAAQVLPKYSVAVGNNNNNNNNNKEEEERRVCFWAVPPHNFEMPYEMTEYASHLCDLLHEDDYYCPTDSRLRPDLRALAGNIMDRALYYKGHLEDQQRIDRRELETKEGKETKWKPVWFAPVSENIYVYTGGYWEQAAIRHGEVPATEEEKKNALVDERILNRAMYYPKYKFAENPANLTEEMKAKYDKWRSEKIKKDEKEQDE